MWFHPRHPLWWLWALGDVEYFFGGLGKGLLSAKRPWCWSDTTQVRVPAGVAALRQILPAESAQIVLRHCAWQVAPIIKTAMACQPEVQTSVSQVRLFFLWFNFWYLTCERVKLENPWKNPDLLPIVDVRHFSQDHCATTPHARALEGCRSRWWPQQWERADSPPRGEATDLHCTFCWCYNVLTVNSVEVSAVSINGGTPKIQSWMVYVDGKSDGKIWMIWGYPMILPMT